MSAALGCQRCSEVFVAEVSVNGGSTVLAKINRILYNDRSYLVR